MFANVHITNCVQRVLKDGLESRRHSSGHAFVRFLTPGELFGEKIVRADVTMEKLKERLKDAKHDQVTCDGCGIEPVVRF